MVDLSLPHVQLCTYSYIFILWNALLTGYLVPDLGDTEWVRRAREHANDPQVIDRTHSRDFCLDESP